MAFREEAASAIAQAYQSLNRAERLIAQDTTWLIKPLPTTEELALAGAKPGDIMLGLYQKPPYQAFSTVTLFQANIERQAVAPWVVVEHELTHVLGYDHALRAAGVNHGCGVGATPGCSLCPVAKPTPAVPVAAALVPADRFSHWAGQLAGHLPGHLQQAAMADLLAQEARPWLHRSGMG